ncbi:hypothetical protein FOS14_12860 [Skermania sp. ID1734]|uniref:DMT family transporter n=1 Tax=Skermania sp. ID1734 TaxID=2597516 RepID=UPI00117F2EB7|nr:DMT family transporter [Skermania sp. ID1734]TSD99243.1 hypothetical protein FOS14_12860 [Skermania sp. ID1734]
MVYLLGLAAAAFLAVGFVLQQHAAEEEPAALRLHPGLLLDLARRPRWLLGIASMVVGQVLSAVALDQGALALVEPLLAANLLFALPLTALYHRIRVPPADLVGAAILIVGLGVFVAASQPEGGSTRSPGVLAWSLAFAALAAVLAVLLILQRRANTEMAAGLLATGAGLLFGMQDTLTQGLDNLVDRGLLHAVTNWMPYALVALAILGLLLAQSAFNEASLSSSLPPITATEPVVGIALALALYGEGIRTTPLAITGEVLGLVAIVVGIVVVGRSPIVTGEHPECR